MTEKQEKALHIIYDIVGNCYVTKEEYMTLVEAILEHNSGFIPGTYPSTYPYTIKKPWDQDQGIVYKTSTGTQPEFINTSVTGEKTIQSQMICERTYNPKEWSDNEF